MAETASLQIKVTSSGINAAGYHLGELAVNGEKASNSIDKVSKSTKKATKATDRFTKAYSAARIAIASVVAGLGVREITNYSDQWKNVTNRLTLATKTTEELAKAQKAVFDISQDTRSELSATAELYQRLSMNAGDYITSQEDLAEITSTVNKAIGLSGVSAEAAQGAIVQLSQGLAAGALRGEEFNSVVENAPRLAKLLADGLGVPVGALRDLAGEGKLTSEAVINAIRSQTGVINQEYIGLLPKISEGWTKVNNSTTAAIGKFDGISRASEIVYGVLDDVSSAMDFLTEDTEALSEVFETASQIVTLLAVAMGSKLTISMGNSIASSKAMTVAMAIMGDTAVATTVKTNSLGMIIGRSSVQATVATAAFSRLKVAMAFMGGPAGLFITAAVGIGMLASSYIDSKKSTDQLTDSSGKLIDKLEEINDIAGLSKLGAAEAQLVAVRKRIEDLNKVDLKGYNGRGVEQLGKAKVKALEEESKALAAIKQIKADIKESDEREQTKVELKKVEDLNKAYEKTKANLTEEIGLFNSIGKAAQLRYQLDHGELKNLDNVKKESIEKQIKQLEQLEEAKNNSDNYKDTKQSLMTEEEEILTSYSKRKAHILASTEATEREKNDLLKRLNDELNNDLIGSLGDDVGDDGSKNERLARLQEEYLERHDIIMGNTQITGEERNALLTELDLESNEVREEINNGFWQRYLESMEKNLENMDELTSNMINNFSSGLGSAFESMVFDSESLGDAFDKMMIGIGRSTINALGQMAGQWLAYQAVQLLASKGAAATEAQAQIGRAVIGVNQAGINAYAQAAAIGGVAAGGVAQAAAIAATTPYATSIATLATAGMFDHGGMIGAGKVGVVGEYGAELVTGPAFVTSRRTTESSHSGSESTQAPNITIVQEFNIHGSRDSELEAMLRAAASQGAEEGYNKVYQDMRSNGAIKQLTRR